MNGDVEPCRCIAAGRGGVHFRSDHARPAPPTEEAADAATTGDVERLASEIDRTVNLPHEDPLDISCGDVARTVLASDWLAAHDAEVAARALREVADDWTQGQWSDVMLPKPTPPAVPVIAYANRIGDWLRARADRVAGHAQEDE